MTVLNQTPSAFRQLIEVDGREGRELSLRLVIFGGEALELNSLRPWFERHGEERPQLVNMYGITETTVHVTYRPLRLSDLRGLGVIGAGLPDLKVCVLNQQLHPVPTGVAGELDVGGAGLGRGYLNRAELTAERFIPDPFSTLKGARLYKTVMLPDCSNGDFEYLGRADEQVKIRGFRIELGEIEMVLNQHAAVREAVVVRQDGAEPRLVAYVVGTDNELLPAELRLYMKDRLPDYMVPSAVALLDHLPLTPNGKVDRRALAALKVEGAERDESLTESRLPIEEMLAGIWSEVLGIEQVKVHDNFFDLGGHSLLATQVVSRVRGEFKIEVPLRSLFEAPTLSGFAAVVQAAMRDKQGLSAPPIKPVSREIELHLSFAQQRLWIAEQLVKGSAVYHLPAAVRFKGQLNISALERSLNELIRRHETLRTSFPLVNGTPLQIIAPSLELPLPLIDLSELPETGREAAAGRLANEFIMAPFDLSTEPLLRAKLIRVGEHEHIALFVMHHIISDGWSMGVLVRDIAALYNAFIEVRSSPLAELPVHTPIRCLAAGMAPGRRAGVAARLLEKTTRP